MNKNLKSIRFILRNGFKAYFRARRIGQAWWANRPSFSISAVKIAQCQSLLDGWWSKYEKSFDFAGISIHAIPSEKLPSINLDSVNVKLRATYRNGIFEIKTDSDTQTPLSNQSEKISD